MKLIILAALVGAAAAGWECSVCELAVGELVKYGLKGLSEQQVVDEINKECVTKLPGFLQQLCEGVLDPYAKKIYEGLEDGKDAAGICSDVLKTKC